MDLLTKLSSFKPLQEFRFGHSPLQIEYFKTLQQNGSIVFTYWQHVLQLKGLYNSIQELQLDLKDVEDDLADANHFFPFWSLGKRKRKIPRLQFKKKAIEEAIEQKTREANVTYSIIQEKFSDCLDLTEDEIFSQEKEYWTIRLGKQLVCSQLARKLGIPEGNLEAILALPEAQQQELLLLASKD